MPSPILSAFCAHVARGGTCYTLIDSDDEIAEIESPHYGRPTVIFWSDSARAQACAKGAFEDCDLEEISPEELLTDWLPGLAEDGFLVSLDWDPKTMFGPEIEPADLKAEIVKLRGGK